MSDFGTTSRPKARKSYRCDQCNGTIQPGETYVRWTGKYDGVMQTTRDCHACDDLAHALYDHNFYGEGAYGEETLPWLLEVDDWRGIRESWPELGGQIDAYRARLRGEADNTMCARFAAWFFRQIARWDR